MLVLVVALAAAAVACDTYGMWLRARAAARLAAEGADPSATVASSPAADAEWARGGRWLRAASLLTVGMLAALLVGQIAAAVAGGAPWTRPGSVALLCAGLLAMETDVARDPRGPWAGGLMAAFGVFLRARRNRIGLALVAAGALLLLA